MMSILIHGSIGSGKTSLVSKIALDSGFTYVKKINPELLLSLNSELSVCSYITKIFQNSKRSNLSIIILDNIERIIEYVNIGPRFSNSILQTLMTILSTDNSTQNSKLLIIGTTSTGDVLEDLGINQLFSKIFKIDDLNITEMKFIAKKILNTDIDLDYLLDSQNMPIKKLLIELDN